MRRRPLLTMLTVAGVLAAGGPRGADAQRASPTASTASAASAAEADAEAYAPRLQGHAWPHPAAGESASGDPELVLTFDDGPSPATTGRILDILARYQAPAVFFLQGWRFQRGDPAVSAGLVQRMLAEGHVIANHTIDHARLCWINAGLRTHQILGARAILEEVSGVPVPWFRAPYGERCGELEAELERLRLQHFHWDIDPQEWRNRGPRYTAAQVVAKLTRLRGRAVLIMHDTKDATTIALPKILDWIAFENRRRLARGLRPIRLVSGAQVARERLAPSLTWLERAGTEAAASLTHGLGAALP